MLHMQSFGVPSAPRKGYDTKLSANMSETRREDMALLAPPFSFALCTSVNAGKGISFVFGCMLPSPNASRFCRPAL